jgi:hypothetical protein
VKKELGGLRACDDSSAIMIRKGDELVEPAPSKGPIVDDERAAELARRVIHKTWRTRRGACDLSAYDEETRVAIAGTLARFVDLGKKKSTRAMHGVARSLPPEKIPREVAAAALRRVFTARSDRERAYCADILGMYGCREAIGALGEAVHLHPDATFARAAARALERIRTAPPE